MNKLELHSHWLLRVALASVFLFHGLGKVPNIPGFAEMMGLPVIVAGLVTFAEVAGGLGILLGAATRPLITRIAAVAMIPVLLGAIFMVHGPRWSFVPTEEFPMGGMEFQVVLLLLATWFLVVGNGEDRAGARSRVEVPAQSRGVSV